MKLKSIRTIKALKGYVDAALKVREACQNMSKEALEEDIERLKFLCTCNLILSATAFGGLLFCLYCLNGGA